MLGLKHFEKKTHIIFDWNGTLLDDLDLCLETIAFMLKRCGLPELDKDRYRRVFRMPVVEYYRDLGFDMTMFETLAAEFIKRYHESVDRCSLFQGAKEFLEELRTAGKRLAVLSAAREGELKYLIRHFGIEHCFDAIFGLSDIYAASKVERGKELMAYWKVEPEAIILVGDMDHDVEVGRALGIDVLVLADGHQHYERLKQIHPLVLESRYTD